MVPYIDDADALLDYLQFMKAGGFDSPCVNESWERLHRQQTRCTHGLMIRDCESCSPPKTPYWTGL